MFTEVATHLKSGPKRSRKYYYDPEGAEKLLDEAGYPRGADGIRFKTEYDAFGPVRFEL